MNWICFRSSVSRRGTTQNQSGRVPARSWEPPPGPPTHQPKSPQQRGPRPQSPPHVSPAAGRNSRQNPHRTTAPAPGARRASRMSHTACFSVAVREFLARGAGWVACDWTVEEERGGGERPFLAWAGLGLVPGGGLGAVLASGSAAPNWTFIFQGRPRQGVLLRADGLRAPRPPNEPFGPPRCARGEARPSQRSSSFPLRTSRAPLQKPSSARACCAWRQCAAREGGQAV